MESRGLSNMKTVIDFIVDEITEPFGDKRGPVINPTLEDLFFHRYKEKREDIRVGKTVTCKIKGCYMTTLNARTFSGINCNIQNIPQELMKDFKINQVITGKIT